MCWTTALRLAAGCAVNHSHARGEVGQARQRRRARASSPRRAAAARPPSARAAASRRRRRCAARRSRSRPPRPTGPCRSSADGDQREVLEELGRQVLVGRGRARRAASAISSRFRQYIAIHAVPSDCSSRPPTGSARAVERADVVEAEEAALEDVVALGVLAVDPPGEVQQQLVEDALEEVVVAVGRRSRTRAARPTRAPAG